MLERARTLCVYAFTAAMAALLGGFATENLPDGDADETLAAIEATPVTTPDGWVVKEVQVHMPMVARARSPFGLRFEDDDVRSPKLAIPKHLPGSMPIPSWVPKGMVPHLPPQMNPWTGPRFDAEPEAVDPGSLKTNDRLIDDGSGGLMLVRERRWTSDGVSCQDVQYRTLDELDELAPPTHVSSSVQGKAGRTVGVGISANSKGGVRVYRYQDGGVVR